MTKSSTVEEDVAVLLRLLHRVFVALKRSGDQPPAELLELFSPSGLGPRHAPALMTLVEAGAMTVGQLAGRMELTLATTSLLLGQLDHAGLVVRHPDPEDRRRTIVALAPERREVVERWLAARRRPLEATLAQLDEAERRAFVRAVELLAGELADPTPGT